MTYRILLATIREYKQAGITNLDTITNLANDMFGDWLASQGVSHLEMLDENKLCLNITGQLKEHTPSKGIQLYSRFLVISLDDITENTEAIQRCPKILYFRW